MIIDKEGIQYSTSRWMTIGSLSVHNIYTGIYIVLQTYETLRERERERVREREITNNLGDTFIGWQPLRTESMSKWPIFSSLL